MDEDAQLIGRYLGGEALAGSLLVARHSHALFCWLRWQTGSREDAEDLTQAVWLRAFPALPRLEDRAAFRAWLWTILRHEFLHWLRSHKPACSLEALGDSLDSLIAHSECEILNGVEDRLALEYALNRLSEEHRDTFMLRYLSQLTAQETANVLEVPVGTVESRCHFARARLRELLGCDRLPEEAQGQNTAPQDRMKQQYLMLQQQKLEQSGATVGNRVGQSMDTASASLPGSPMRHGTGFKGNGK